MTADSPSPNAAAALSPAGDVPRVALAELTPARFFREFRRGNRPVVITGALEGLEPWTLDVLAGNLGERKYPVSIFGKDYRRIPKRDWARLCDVRDHSMREFAGFVRDGTAHAHFMYFAQIGLKETPLRARLEAPVAEVGRRCGLEPRGDLQLWVGPSGHTSPLHFDSGDGTLLQLRGAKHVVLFPPAQTKNLYLFPYYSRVSPRFSQVDTDRPDFRVFPRYREALRNRLETVLGQGEILFIPFNWWHDVTALGDDYVCSVNRSWVARPVAHHFCHVRSLQFFLRRTLPLGLGVRAENFLRRFFAPQSA